MRPGRLLEGARIASDGRGGAREYDQPQTAAGEAQEGTHSSPGGGWWLAQLPRSLRMRSSLNSSGQDSSPIHSGLLLCLVGKAIGDTRRTRVNRNVEDEAPAGAAARPSCSQTTLRGTYLVAFDGVDISGNAQVPFAAAELE